MAQSDPLWNPDAPLPPPGEHELPYDDGEPMESPEHRMQMNLLIESLEEAWSEREDFYVGGNMFVYFSEKQVKNNDFRGPDVFVVLGTTRRRRLSWVAWGEDGKLPDVVIELTSNRTRHVDYGEKKRIYAEVWRTPEYFLYDPFTHVLEGFRLNAGTLEYEPIAPNANGDLECRVLGLGLGVRHGRHGLITWPWLRWLDAGGAALPTSLDRAFSAEARAEAERTRADEERARADEERARADEERARADEERARAEAERARADELERRVRDLEAKRRSS